MEKIYLNSKENPFRKEHIEVEVLELEDEPHQIVLHNDDYNTFDFVIQSLIEICEHTTIQAEQCTYLVHYKGKCTVLTGSLEELTPKCTLLLERGLSAELT